jgi:hypothetical protein
VKKVDGVLVCCVNHWGEELGKTSIIRIAGSIKLSSVIFVERGRSLTKTRVKEIVKSRGRPCWGRQGLAFLLETKQ